MRRLISLVSASVALVALGLVLYNATAVDRKPPGIKAITLSAPTTDPREAQTLTAIDIEFSEPVRTATVESRFHIAPVVDGAFTWDGSTAIFTPSQKLPADSAFTVRIDPGVEDLAGNVDEAGLDGWAFRTVGAPVVLRVTPADAATGEPVSGQVELVFDRLMDTVSVEAAIKLEPSATVSATWRGSVVTLDFGAGLRFGTSYALTIGAEAADTGGSRLGTPFVTHFTTVAAGLATKALVPADGVAGIGIGSPIAVQFDAPIDPETARSALHIVPSVDGDLRIVPRGGDLGTGPLPTVASAPDTLLFLPSTPLAAHTTYTVTIDPTIARSDDPTAVFSGRTWTFTTGSPTSSGQNQIAFLSARSGVRNVWVMNPDGTNQRQLTVDIAPVSSFDTSADGGEVAYAAGGVVTVMAIDGSGARRLTNDDGRLEYGPVFTPDDTHLVVARRSAGGGDLGYWLVPLPGTAGDERQVLDHGAPPLGSGLLAGDGIGLSDGSTPWTPGIAFDPGGSPALIATATGDLYVLSIREPGPGQVAPAPIRVPLTGGSVPAWLPARSAFVVAAAGGAPGLYAVDAVGAATILSDSDGSVGSVAPGPDGSVVAMVRRAAGLSQLRVFGANGSHRDLPQPAGREDRWPAFSPNGLMLLVGRTPAAQPDSSAGIWLIDVDSGVAQQLTSDGAYARWIP